MYTGISATARQSDLKHLNRDIRNRALQHDSTETKEAKFQKAYQDMIRIWPNKVFRDYRFNLMDPLALRAKLRPQSVPPPGSQAALQSTNTCAAPVQGPTSFVTSRSQTMVQGKSTSRNSVLHTYSSHSYFCRVWFGSTFGPG